MNYSLVATIALIIHFIINFDILFKRANNDKVSALKQYRAFLVVIAIFYIVDIAWGLFDHYGLYLAANIDTSLYFAAIAVMLYAWTNYVVKYLDERTRFDKLMIAVGWIFLVVEIGIVFANGFWPILFDYVDGQYVIGPARYVIFGSQILLFIFTSIYAFIESGKFTGIKRRNHITIGFFGIVMTSFIILQFVFPLWPMYAVGCLTGVTLIRAFVIANEKRQYRDDVVSFKELAYTDALTGVKSKHAYVLKEEEIDLMIRDNQIGDFAVAVFDLNNLKKINDKNGHEAGDQYIIASVNLIKSFFPQSEIYRFGGDEFIIILQGEEYDNRFRIIDAFNAAINNNLLIDGPIVATGISDYRPKTDNTLRAIFIRADDNMYARKRMLKKSSQQEDKDKEDNIDPVSNSDIRTDFYDLLSHNGPHSLIDFLNNSSCDEILEVDMNTNTYKQYYHVEGKYFVPLAGSSYKELLDFTYNYIVHPDDRDAYMDLMSPEGFFAKLRGAVIHNFRFARFRYKLQDGDYRYVEQCVIAGEENGLAPGIFRLYIFDIHNIVMRKLGQVYSDESDVISKDRDSLTGLLKEKFFFIKASEILKENPKNNWCLISLDIYHFKYFDQWYGREAGDYLLAKIGADLSNHDKKHGSLSGYLGQDDFVILTEYDPNAIDELYEKVRSLITSHGLAFGFLPIIGVAMISGEMTIVDAFDRATIAASNVKNDPRKRVYIYNEEMQFANEKETRLLSELKTAFDKDEITFYIQPQCRISTKKIVGGEVLARWIKTDGTIVPPGDFIPVLEKYGFITDLDQRIWEKACIWLRSWLDAGNEAVPLSLNVSRADIFAIDINKFFTEITEKYNIPHKLIKIEITESAYTETTDLIIELVNKLRKNGFLVLMDDFGSGYSSLNMLSNLKVDAIKLDANFLHIEGADYEKGIHILESVVNMSKLIALPIIVEGVETQQQSDFLEELGCRYVQGYHFYRPMPIKQFETLLKEANIIDPRGFVVKLNEQFRLREFLDKNVYSDSMLNSIIGAVAIYAWHDGTHVDIIRFNQQFYESVNVPDFHERLVNIEQFLPPEDHPKMLKALKEAMDNKLSGSNVYLRFYRTNGELTTYQMHFYYLGKKEGQERFYGSANNITEFVTLQEQLRIISNYSTDNIIFLSRISDKWHYTVASHGLADVIGLSPKELEDEMNDGRFAAKRVVDKKNLQELMRIGTENANNKQDFEFTITVKDRFNKTRKILLTFVSVDKQSNNIEYILFTNVID